ncbi:MAG: hypothetical protein H6754_02735 [Candidatus Omnitrophica bacterium]|nr:hypothetical protein [Candidatus Omnitrophota bacterium]
MKLPFGKKDAAAAGSASKPAPQAAPKVKAVKPSSKSLAAPDGKKQIVTGLIFISVSFLGAIFLFYLTVNAQSAKEEEVKELSQELLLVGTEKDAAYSKAKTLQAQVGRVIDLDKVVTASQKVHGEKEANRIDGTLWIDRKSQKYIMTLGILNGVTKGSRLIIYDGDNKLATIKVISALDVVSFGEPVDKKITDFTKDYYQVKSQ